GREPGAATRRGTRARAADPPPATDAPLDLTAHDTWLVRQICIDYVPRALDHFLALPSDRASEPLLDGRSARQVLDEQLATIDQRLDELADRAYRREAGGVLNHARVIADSLRPDPFHGWLGGLATKETAPAASAQEPAAAVEAPATAETTLVRERERA